MKGLDPGVAAILMVAVVNGYLLVHQIRQGGDPFGYFNAAFISILWAIGMVLDNRRASRATRNQQTEGPT